MTSRAWALLALMAVAMLLASALTPAAAAEYPNVAGLQPFSAETNYMSLAGYLRWMTFKEQSVWLSMAEAQRIVAEQR